MRYTLLCLFLVCLVTHVAEGQQDSSDSKKSVENKLQQTAHRLDLKSDQDEGASMGYLKFLPTGYLAEEAAAKETGNNAMQKWPLMLFLHGAGERGDDLNLVKVWGPPKRVAEQPDFPFVLISPQCPKGTYWNTSHLNQLIDETVKNHRIDPARIYVTGLSMGGYGTWKLVAEHPTKFAAAIPICGGGDPNTAAQLAQTPIWAFHGEKDRVVGVEKTTSMVDAIRKIDGADIKVTLYPDAGHNSWSETYGNPKIYEWLLSHSR